MRTLARALRELIGSVWFHNNVITNRTMTDGLGILVRQALSPDPSSLLQTPFLMLRVSSGFTVAFLLCLSHLYFHSLLLLGLVNIEQSNHLGSLSFVLRGSREYQGLDLFFWCHPKCQSWEIESSFSRLTVLYSHSLCVSFLSLPSFFNIRGKEWKQKTKIRNTWPMILLWAMEI